MVLDGNSEHDAHVLEKQVFSDKKKFGWDQFPRKHIFFLITISTMGRLVFFAKESDTDLFLVWTFRSNISLKSIEYF